MRGAYLDYWERLADRPDADQAAHAEPGRHAPARRQAAAEQRHAAVQRARREGQQRHAAMVCGPHGGGEADRLLHRRVQHRQGVPGGDRAATTTCCATSSRTTTSAMARSSGATATCCSRPAAISAAGALANFLQERDNPLNTQRLHPHQVHAGRSAGRRSAGGHRLGQLQPALAAHQRREHAGDPRRHARRRHLFRRVHAHLRSPLCALPGAQADAQRTVTIRTPAT